MAKKTNAKLLLEASEAVGEVVDWYLEEANEMKHAERKLSDYNEQARQVEEIMLDAALIFDILKFTVKDDAKKRKDN